MTRKVSQDVVSTRDVASVQQAARRPAKGTTLNTDQVSPDMRHFAQKQSQLQLGQVKVPKTRNALPNPEQREHTYRTQNKKDRAVDVSMADCDVITEGDGEERKRVQHKEKPATLSPNVRRAKGTLVQGGKAGPAVALKTKYSHRSTQYKVEQRASPNKKSPLK